MVRPETRQVARSLVLRTCLPSMIMLHAPCLSPYLLRQEVYSRILCWQKFPDSDLEHPDCGAPRLSEAKVPYSSSGLSLSSARGRTKPRTSSPTYPFPQPTLLPAGAPFTAWGQRAAAQSRLHSLHSPKPERQPTGGFMGKRTLALFSPTPPPAVPRSPSQCGTTQGSSRTCPANSQVLLESPPSSLSSLRDSAFITFPTSPPPESPLNPLPISSQRGL